jgi:hypothetical protein
MVHNYRDKQRTHIRPCKKTSRFTMSTLDEYLVLIKYTNYVIQYQLLPIQATVKSSMFRRDLYTIHCKYSYYSTLRIMRSGYSIMTPVPKKYVVSVIIVFALYTVQSNFHQQRHTVQYEPYRPPLP